MALVSVDEIKLFLGITDNTHNDKLSLTANVISKSIETYCDRRFEAANTIEFHNGGCFNVFIKNPPVNQVFYLREYNGTEYANLVVSNSISSNTQVIFQNDSGKFTKNFSDNDTTFFAYQNGVEILYNGGFTEIPQDLKLASLGWVKHIFKNQEGVQGTTFSNLGLTLIANRTVPEHIREIVDWYRL